ncbi:vesicle transport v-SNARE protein [Dictyocaulus viviparus]|uniref:Golgi SNAP receptor complex member 1 n=1 Tax=Dictyocaulus viviparus TaxID=29172 RepID=A0A0D8Y8C8_DICVI|nr:vesicle transport v-SNARE protein [Dictyocaulus viviparus]
MNPVSSKHFSSNREDAWRRVEFQARKNARHMRGRRSPDRFLYDYPPVKVARTHSGDSLREPSYNRPPSLLDCSFPDTSAFSNLTRFYRDRLPFLYLRSLFSSPSFRKQLSPKIRDAPYESRNRVVLESWRVANETLPARRAESMHDVQNYNLYAVCCHYLTASGAWVKPAGRLTSAIVDTSPKTVNQRVKQIAALSSNKAGQVSNSINSDNDSILTSNLISAHDYEDEDERLARIRNDLERMKHEDKEGYELLLKVLAGAKDSTGPVHSVEVDKESIEEDNFTAKQCFTHRPDYEMKVEGSRKFQEKSDHPKAPRSPSAPACNPLRNPVGINESEKKPIPLLSAPVSASTQLRWESWRNLSSAKCDTSFRSPWKDFPVTPSDSWRTSTVSPMASSWRSVNKTDYGSSSLTLGDSSELNRRSGRNVDLGELSKKFLMRVGYGSSYTSQQYRARNEFFPRYSSNRGPDLNRPGSTVSADSPSRRSRVTSGLVRASRSFVPDNSRNFPKSRNSAPENDRDGGGRYMISRDDPRSSQLNASFLNAEKGSPSISSGNFSSALERGSRYKYLNEGWLNTSKYSAERKTSPSKTNNLRERSHRQSRNEYGSNSTKSAHDNYRYEKIAESRGSASTLERQNYINSEMQLETRQLEERVAAIQRELDMLENDNSGSRSSDYRGSRNAHPQASHCGNLPSLLDFSAPPDSVEKARIEREEVNLRLRERELFRREQELLLKQRCLRSRAPIRYGRTVISRPQRNASFQKTRNLSNHVRRPTNFRRAFKPMKSLPTREEREDNTVRKNTEEEDLSRKLDRDCTADALIKKVLGEDNTDDISPRSFALVKLLKFCDKKLLVDEISAKVEEFCADTKAADDEEYLISECLRTYNPTTLGPLDQYVPLRSFEKEVTIDNSDDVLSDETLKKLQAVMVDYQSHCQMYSKVLWKFGVVFGPNVYYCGLWFVNFPYPFEDDLYCYLCMILYLKLCENGRGLRRIASMSNWFRLTNSIRMQFSGRLDSDEKTFSARQALFDSLTQEIEGLLTKLTHVNDEMNDVVGAQSSAGWAMNPAVQHTLRRHREILRDYSTEFRRARDNVFQQLQRESLLLGGVNESTKEGSCLNNRVKGSDLYLKENEHITSCDKLLDEQMSIAVATKGNLQRQGMNLRGIGKKMDTLASKCYYHVFHNFSRSLFCS